MSSKHSSHLSTTQGSASASQPSGRFARGMLAHVFTIALRIVTQLAFLPILFAFLTASQVGFWSMLLALPAYCIIAAQGIATAGANAAIQNNNSDTGQAGAIYRAVCRKALVTALTTWLTIWILAEVLLFRSLIGPFPIGLGELRSIALLLGLSAMFAAALCALEVPLRFSGRYPTFVVFAAAGTAAELAGLAVALLLGGEFVAMAAAIAAARAMVWLFARHAARAAAPLLFATDEAPLPAIWRPALAFMLLPLTYAINLQAYVLLVGGIYGTATLAAFVATRMLARLFDLFTGFVFSASFYEAAHTAPAQNGRLKQLAASLTLLALLAGLVFWMALLMLGPWLQQTWTLNKTAFDPSVAGMILAAAVCRAVSAFPSAVLAARNAHGPFTTSYLGLSMAAFAACSVAMASGMPLWQTLLIPFIAEAIHTALVLRQFLNTTGRSDEPFLRAVFSHAAVLELTRAASALRWRKRTHV